MEYLLNLLLYGSKEDKASVVIEKGKGVNDLERRIQKFKSGDRERSSRSVVGSIAGDDGRGCEGASGNDR